MVMVKCNLSLYDASPTMEGAILAPLPRPPVAALWFTATTGRGFVMDDRERDRFYLSTPDEADGGDDYELEPPDAEVLAAEERRAQETIDATRASIDIDEIYRDADRERGREIVEDWIRDFRFRFQVKHLLIATAVLAIVLTLAKLDILRTAVVLVVMVSVTGLFLYLQWQERKQRVEADRRRREMYAQRRTHFERSSRPAGDDADASMAGAVDEALGNAQGRPQFRFHFSLLELMAAMTVAAIIFGLVHLLGGASNTATLLGFVALIGLVIHALGFEPPEIVVLGWWLILVLYVLLSIFAAVWSGFA